MLLIGADSASRRGFAYGDVDGAARRFVAHDHHPHVVSRVALESVSQIVKNELAAANWEKSGELCIVLLPANI